MSFDTTKYLADPSDLADRLGVDAQNKELLLALRRVSDRFRGAVHHPVHRVEDETIYLSGDGGPSLQLPAAPIIGTPTITHGARPMIVQIGYRSGLLRCDNGFPDGLENIEVTYTHGYFEIPGDIQDAVLEVAEAACTHRPGVDLITTGNETVRFNSAIAAGGTTPLWADAVAKYIIGGNGDRA